MLGIKGKIVKVLKSKILQCFSPDRPFLWILVCILLWIVSLRGFLFTHNSLYSDAGSYYDHTKYFVESIKQGVFPLWDHFWQNGAPNDFFLRRIGCYNPLYLLMALVNSLGVPFRETYLLAHASYYFLGAWGLFLLGRRIWQDERPAFFVFALFLFSAIGTRIFDSYMCLMVVPLIWFFYFAYSFFSLPSRLGLAGLVLVFMIMANTYIPLYAMTIVLAAFLFWLLIFPREASASLGRAIFFFQGNLFFALGLFFLLSLSLIPPLLFFKQGSQGAIALPGRHSAGVTGNVISVDKTLLNWGLIEDVFFSFYFVDLRRYILAIIFVPAVSLVLWIMGAFCRLNRRIVFYIILGLFFVLLGTPRALPLYDFLYQNVFYFKYFRNLHFFLWFLVIPLFIFTAGEFFNSLLRVRLDKSSDKAKAFLLVAVTHIGLLTWVILSKNAIFSTVFCLIASSFFCSWYIFVASRKAWVFWLALVVLTGSQALEVYYYASDNMSRYSVSNSYDNLNKDFVFPVASSSGDWTKRNECSGLYYSSASQYEFCTQVSSGAFAAYPVSRLTTYTKVAPFEQGGYARLEATIRSGANIALVEGWQGGSLGATDKKEDLMQNTKELKVLRFNAGELLLKTDFLMSRFLVYNDSWDTGWRVYIDRKEAKLYRANGAFKGVIVPAGARRVHFQYGSSGWILFNWFLFGMFNALFVLILYMSMKRIKGKCVC